MRFLLLITSLAAIHSARGHFPVTFDKPLDTIAFGSCNDEDQPQTLFNVITEKAPDLWIWCGDNIYADKRPIDGRVQYRPVSDPATMEAQYQKLFNDPIYAAFRQKTPIIGTWDDHDYGKNNADSRYPMKVEAARLALDFFEVPMNDPRRKRPGIYGDYTFGTGENSTHVILLDGRTFAIGARTPHGDILGTEQWAWLKETLLKSKAPLKLIISGTQVISPDHRYEKWADFPESRQKLLKLVHDNAIPGVVFISGDRHIHTFSVQNDAETPYPLFDLTSSGMTHSWEDFPGEPNRFAFGKPFTGMGFGLLTINWDATPRTLTAEILDSSGNARRSLVIAIDDLVPNHN